MRNIKNDCCPAEFPSTFYCLHVGRLLVYRRLIIILSSGGLPSPLISAYLAPSGTSVVHADPPSPKSLAASVRESTPALGLIIPSIARLQFCLAISKNLGSNLSKIHRANTESRTNWLIVFFFFIKKTFVVHWIANTPSLPSLHFDEEEKEEKEWTISIPAADVMAPPSRRSSLVDNLSVPISHERSYHEPSNSELALDLWCENVGIFKNQHHSKVFSTMLETHPQLNSVQKSYSALKNYTTKKRLPLSQMEKNTIPLKDPVSSRQFNRFAQFERFRGQTYGP